MNQLFHQKYESDHYYLENFLFTWEKKKRKRRKERNYEDNVVAHAPSQEVLMINSLPFWQEYMCKSFFLGECGGWRCPDPSLDSFELASRGWHNDEISVSHLPLTELHGRSQKST